jgi:hypothetical protein
MTHESPLLVFWEAPDGAVIDACRRTMCILLERQLWEERLPDGKHLVIRERRQREAEIRRKARRHLGRQEEDEAHD